MNEYIYNIDSYECKILHFSFSSKVYNVLQVSITNENYSFLLILLGFGNGFNLVLIISIISLSFLYLLPILT